MVAAVAVGFGVASENSAPAHLTILHKTVPSVTTQGQVFLAGAVVAAVLLAGLMLLVLGARRAIRLRQTIDDLEEEREESLSALVAENERLRRELARTPRGAGRTPPAPGTTAQPGGAPVPAFFDSTSS
jgi:hypothetical protein